MRTDAHDWSKDCEKFEALLAKLAAARADLKVTVNEGHIFARGKYDENRCAVEDLKNFLKAYPFRLDSRQLVRVAVSQRIGFMSGDYCLSDGSDEMRGLAYRELARRGVRPLMELLDGPTAEVRSAACECLDIFGHDAVPGLVLAAAVDDQRDQAIGVLARIRDSVDYIGDPGLRTVVWFEVLFARLIGMNGTALCAGPGGPMADEVADRARKTMNEAIMNVTVFLENNSGQLDSNQFVRVADMAATYFSVEGEYSGPTRYACDSERMRQLAREELVRRNKLPSVSQ